MAQINDLPFELMSLIFNLAYESSRDLVHPEYYKDTERGRILLSIHKPPNPPETKWASDNLRDPSLFPFNTAWVCKWWRDVLKGSPKYWTRIVFDVVNNPTPLLDAFTWSTDHKISVLVFSSMNDTTEEGKTCENGRIGSIVRHLQPHIERCTSIDFHATFASSLPSPTLFLALEVLDLEDLTLEYQVHDLAHVADNRKRARITHNLTSHAVVAFPKLTKLSLSGHAFMDILRLGDGRLSRVKNDFYLTLHISDFQFMNTKRHTDDSGTFFVFMQLISALSPLGGIHLKNLSLSYRPHKRRDTEYLYHVDAASISFDNVSPGFIMEFFQLATLNVNCTTFSHCSFPPVSGSFSSYCLTIEDMPSSDISAHNDDSLYNIISIWNNGDCLEVASCPAFNDEFLHWLGEEREDGKVEAEQNQIKLLQVRDCTNFTAGALRRLIDILNDSARLDLLEREPVTRLLEVMVSGRGPALDVEDLEWFRKNSGATGVRWKVDGADGSKVFLEHLPD